MFDALCVAPRRRDADSDETEAAVLAKQLHDANDTIRTLQLRVKELEEAAAAAAKAPPSHAAEEQVAALKLARDIYLFPPPSLTFKSLF